MKTFDNELAAQGQGLGAPIRRETKAPATQEAKCDQCVGQACGAQQGLMSDPVSQGMEKALGGIGAGSVAGGTFQNQNTGAQNSRNTAKVLGLDPVLLDEVRIVTGVAFDGDGSNIIGSVLTPNDVGAPVGRLYPVEPTEMYAGYLDQAKSDVDAACGIRYDGAQLQAIRPLPVDMSNAAQLMVLQQIQDSAILSGAPPVGGWRVDTKIKGEAKFTPGQIISDPARLSHQDREMLVTNSQDSDINVFGSKAQLTYKVNDFLRVMDGVKSTTFQELERWVQNNFVVVEGEPKAWYSTTEGGKAVRRCYVVYGWLTESPEAKTATEQLFNAQDRELKLLAAMWRSLNVLRLATEQDRPLLVVRRGLSMDHEVREVYGQGWMSKEAVEDNEAEVPPGWAMDFTVNRWKPVASRMDVSRISIRCDVPAAPSMPANWYLDSDTHQYLLNKELPGTKPDGMPYQQI